MRLKPSPYLILGMRNRGVATGYAVKRAVDCSTRFFWAASFAHVLSRARRPRAGRIRRQRGRATRRRPRKTYRLTHTGRTTLGEWLHSARTPEFEFRDEGLSRLYFADAMTREEGLELAKRLRLGAEQIERDFHAEILPLAPAGSRPLCPYHGSRGSGLLLMARSLVSRAGERARRRARCTRTLNDKGQYHSRLSRLGARGRKLRA
jgi:DNA-binding PadR family transcriptional regulator